MMSGFLKRFSIVAAVIVLVAAGWSLHKVRPVVSSDTHRSGAPLQVVAGENVWGSLLSQIGGSKVHVLSVVSDPNADPHEYASNTATTRAIAAANYVVLNGAGYDSWGDRLLAAGANPQRTVLHISALLGKKNGDNPHFWYSPAYVNTAAVRMEHDLATLDAPDAAYFAANLRSLQTSLAGYQQRIVAIAQRFEGSQIAATEDIFAYTANAAYLALVSPPAFMQAVAEGNDPPASSVATFEFQLAHYPIKVLVYNSQTVTPLTQSIKKLAAVRHIPILGVSETIQPAGATFQSWMDGQLADLQAMLTQSTGVNR